MNGDVRILFYDIHGFLNSQVCLLSEMELKFYLEASPRDKGDTASSFHFNIFLDWIQECVASSTILLQFGLSLIELCEPNGASDAHPN